MTRAYYTGQEAGVKIGGKNVVKRLSEVCPRYQDGICGIIGERPDMRLLCGEAYPWTVLARTYRDCPTYRNGSDGLHRPFDEFKEVGL